MDFLHADFDTLVAAELIHPLLRNLGQLLGAVTSLPHCFDRNGVVASVCDPLSRWRQERHIQRRAWVHTNNCLCVVAYLLHPSAPPPLFPSIFEYEAEPLMVWTRKAPFPASPALPLSLPPISNE